MQALLLNGPADHSAVTVAPGQEFYTRQVDYFPDWMIDDETNTIPRMTAKIVYRHRKTFTDDMVPEFFYDHTEA
jgi:hypothetical protein